MPNFATATSPLTATSAAATLPASMSRPTTALFFRRRKHLAQALQTPNPCLQALNRRELAIP